jgi:aspartate racemase
VEAREEYSPPLPWLHIAEEVANVAVAGKFRKAAIPGTSFLMEGPVYTDVFQRNNISYCIPEEEQRVRINDIIFSELVYGTITNESKDCFQRIIDELRLKGCDSVVLGCTEIPLIVLPGESSLPVLDLTRILARAALKYSLGNIDHLTGANVNFTA